jgi:2-polyprenyl-3-methyl-5-hydroxy-6-metoxy-1,4-benzoquinol methylase
MTMDRTELDALDVTAQKLDDASYLALVSELSFDGERGWTHDRLVAMRDLLGGWNHNVRLGDGVFTAAMDGLYPAHREVMQVVNAAFGGVFAGKRVLDIGCLEGYFSAECALQGADVVGVEGRRFNLAKCEFVKSALGIERLTFAHDDAIAVTRERYGGFDGVLALGLLYHLWDPFSFLQNMAGLCDGFLLIDTLVALEDLPESICDGWSPQLSELTSFEHAGRRYMGRLYREFESEADKIEKELSLTASLENEQSIWLTEESLFALLRDVGFEQVQKLVYGQREDLWWADLRRDARVLVLATRRRPPFRSKLFA